MQRHVEQYRAIIKLDRLRQHQYMNKYLSVQGHIEQYRAINKLDRLTYVSSTVYVTEIKMFWNCFLFDAFELL